MPDPTISHRRVLLQAQIADATLRLSELKEECEHTFAKKTLTLNDTNYLDGYPRDKWNDCHCEDCGKIWIEYLK
jgi:hypothetical protein